MLTKEFIRRVEDLGYDIDEKDKRIAVRDFSKNYYYLTVGKNLPYSLWTNESLCFRLTDELMNVVFEYIKTPSDERGEQLTETERIILENMDSRWRWIARDADDELTISEDKPSRFDGVWIGNFDVSSLSAFDHLFNFINWNDEEPYNIQGLLEEDEK